MKKQLVSILFALCMVLCLVPLAAFAEESTETPPECSCETACTAESMNTECPVCGAEGASAENCAKYIKPADAAAAQPEGEVSDPQPEKEVSDPQPETALTTLIGGNDTLKEVNSESELTNAIADSTVGTVKLTANIDISNTLTVDRIVTLDLNGKVLQMTGSGSVIKVESSGNLTLTDSNTAAEHKFMPGTNGLWVLNEASGTETVTGGVITGGTGYPFTLTSSTVVYYGGGVYIASGGQLTMTGGNIIGCSATYGGGVCTDSEQTKFSMSGGSIAGCVASNSGGGVRASGTFKMSGQAVIRSCTAESATQFVFGGGVYVNSSSSFEMSGEAKIKGCQAISNSSYSSNGGGVYVSSSSSFVMSEKAQIEDCKAISNSFKSSNGGGVFLANGTSLALSGNAVIQNCTATNSVNSGEAYGGGVRAFYVREITLEGNASIAGCAAANGSGLYITGSTTPGYGKLFANGGSVDGDVVLGDTTEGPCTITGSGRTVFKGKVTVTPGSTIEKGTFNGEVINNGTITGGTFNGTVNNNGTINNGTFNGEVTNNGTINDGTFNTPITGSGTKDDPYQISTAAQLKRFRNIVNGTGGQTQDSGACAVLMNDIVLNDGTFDANGTYTPGSSSKAAEEWTPIGKYTDDNDKTPYTGTFDGQGHTIKGLYVNSASDAYVGLFGCLEGAAVRNLTVDGYVQGYKTAGGIAGYASNAAIENCSNHCSVFGGSDSMLGGIAGLNFDGAKIIDCYNVGTIIRNSTVFEFCGGIVWGNAGTVSNCYNVGTISGNVYDGEIVGRNSGTVENCYYLAGTNLDAVGQSDSYGKTTKTESKTAAEFADGTLLELLKADRNDSPWDSCQYLAAAGKTLPVFKGQGDAHEHNGNWTSNGNGTHSRRCTCNAVETQNCSGGKATCKDKAICEICGDSYGSPEPNNHTDLKHIDAKAATAAEEGNIEYWHCGDCNKYFSDAAAKTEITRADTVTAKLPQPTPPPTAPPTASPTAQPTTAPQAAEQPRRTAQPTAAPTVQPVSTIPATGDTSSPILWAALLLCGGAGLAVTAYKKNRHRS